VVGARGPAAPRPGVPGTPLTVGVGDQEMPTVSLGVPVVVALSLIAGAKAAVHHHHQWRRSSESLRPVEVKRPADTAHINGLSGIPDRDAAGVGCSERMTAAKAAADQDRQHSGEKHCAHSKPSRPHVPIVAAGRIFDK
jgi:hypothetical protein